MGLLFLLAHHLPGFEIPFRVGNKKTLPTQAYSPLPVFPTPDTDQQHTGSANS